jgi:pimeloyl-ACP methyl ester carboxylesterase
VLVGHSYGGIIISGVAEAMRDAIGSIVFLDAFVPESGDSVAAKASQPVRESITAAVEKGEAVMKPVSAAAFRVNEKDRAWVDAMCTPHPLATLTDKITLTGARERIARPLSAPRGIPAFRSMRRRSGPRPTPGGASMNCRAATTPWSTCRSSSRTFW